MKLAYTPSLLVINRVTEFHGLGGRLTDAGEAALREDGRHLGVVVAAEPGGGDPSAFVSWLLDVGEDARKVVHMRAPIRVLAALRDVEVPDAEVEHVVSLAEQFVDREHFRIEAQAEIARLTRRATPE